MSLLMQQFVDKGYARLAEFLSRAKPTLPRVKPLALAADDISRQWASAIYAGQHDLTSEEFAGLVWLDHFARCGRQLLMSHALGLVEAWQRLKRKPAGIAEESRLALELLRANGSFACHLESPVMEPATRALWAQLERLRATRPRSAHEALLKGTTLIETGRQLMDGRLITRDGVQLLEQALPHLIAADGSPHMHGLEEYAAWVSPLLAADDLPFSEPIRHALDRVRPFFSMLIGADHAYVFKTDKVPDPSIHATAPLRLAPHGKIGRLAGGKSVVVALPEGSDRKPELHISSQNYRLVNAGFFEVPNDFEAPFCDVAVQHHPQGQLLQVRLPCVERTVFLNPNGEDMRVEDRLIDGPIPQSMTFTINSESKLSCARSGTEATIAVDKNNVWQLSVRGACLQPGTRNDTIIIEATDQVINWALKRQTRATQKSAKGTQAELFI